MAKHQRKFITDKKKQVRPLPPFVHYVGMKLNLATYYDFLVNLDEEKK